MLAAAEGFEAGLVGLQDLLDQVESLNGTLGEPLGAGTASTRAGAVHRPGSRWGDPVVRRRPKRL